MREILKLLASELIDVEIVLFDAVYTYSGLDYSQVKAHVHPWTIYEQVAAVVVVVNLGALVALHVVLTMRLLIAHGSSMCASCFVLNGLI